MSRNRRVIRCRRDELGDSSVGIVGAPPPPAMRLGARVPYSYHPQADHPQFQDPLTQSPKNQTFHDPQTRSTIETLLHYYRDVLEGIPDREHRTSDDLLALMCPAWNSPAYQQLEKLLRQMPGSLRQALRVRFERYSERRVAFCRKCGTHPVSKVGTIHSHPPGRTITLHGKIVRVLPRDDDPRKVTEALEWLVSHWSGEALLPKAVEQIESERKLKAA